MSITGLTSSFSISQILLLFIAWLWQCENHYCTYFFWSFSCFRCEDTLITCYFILVKIKFLIDLIVILIFLYNRFFISLLHILHNCALNWILTTELSLILCLIFLLLWYVLVLLGFWIWAWKFHIIHSALNKESFAMISFCEQARKMIFYGCVHCPNCFLHCLPRF